MDNWVPARKCKEVRTKLNKNDWQQIFSLGWSAKHRSLLELFYKNGNNFILTQDFQAQIDALWRQEGRVPCLSHSLMHVINRLFRKASLPYRLRWFSVMSAEHWDSAYQLGVLVR